jgi:predicted Zn-dependent protease
MSAAQEKEIGTQGHAAILAEYGLVDDPALSAYVDSIGRALATVSHLPSAQWHFTVLDDPTVNAFALPGGYVYVTRGILAHLNSEAQLAGVLGHEIGHVTARHGARQATQQQLAGLGLGVAGMLSSTVRQYGAAAQQALGLLLLKYGRDDENQSDQLGVDYSTAAGWDPREIPATYETLGRVGEKAGSSLPAFLSTHPDPGDRQVRTTNLARAAAAGKTGLQVRERAYLRRIEGLVFGPDPRNGYFEGARFIHPGMDLELRFPEGWTMQNGASAVVAVAPEQRAGMQMSLANTGGRTPEAYVAELQRAGTIAAAQGSAAAIGGMPAWSGVITASRDGQPVRRILAFVQRDTGRTLQVLGSSPAAGDADEAAILASARSIRRIADAALRTPPIPRLAIVNVAKAGTFESAVKAAGEQAIALDETVILNNRDPDQPVNAGEAIKIVRRAPR